MGRGGQALARRLAAAQRRRRLDSDRDEHPRVNQHSCSNEYASADSHGDPSSASDSDGGELPTTGPTTDPTTGDATTDTGSAEAGGAVPLDDEGCGCTTTDAPVGPRLLALALVCLLARRPRARPR